ncbi:hypothetical protein BC943DRAFT_337576 [Umbelopsis sp. AD052]|nr:hypothetical protein BC943DRAFT_337576 [Umbelopsis sp. AD052]
MANDDQIKVGNASHTSVASEPPKETGPTRGPDIVLRTFQPSDLPYAKHIYYSTYFGQVPQGVKSKLLHPLTWALFIGSYSYLMALVPIVISDMNFPWWTGTALRIFVTFAWTVLSFAGLFVYTDRKEAVDGIEDAMCNDMKDIEEYYLGWNKEERVVEDDKDFSTSKAAEGGKKVTFDKSSKAATEVIKTRKPDEERTASQFWVLTINSIPSATVAIDQHHDIVYNARGEMLAPWKQAGQFLCRRYHLSIPKFLEGPAVPKQTVLFPAHKKNEASLQRLAIQGEYQGFGLSNILISRAMMWANEHNIEVVYAKVNQMQKPTQTILKNKHGFRQISRKSTGWFGQYEVELQCNVKDWVEKYEKDMREKEEIEKQLKEEQSSKEQ